MLVENKKLEIKPSRNIDSSEVFGTTKKILVPSFSEKTEEIENISPSISFLQTVHLIIY